MLVAMTGLPGAGKTMLAEALGIALPAMVVSVDPIETALWRAGLPHTQQVGIASYAVAAAVVEAQLRLRHIVIADAVNSNSHARQVWQRLADGYGCEMPIIEVVCSDHALHRARIEERLAESEAQAQRQQRRRTQGLTTSYPIAAPPVTWAEVEKARKSYQPWPRNRLVIDSAADFEANLKKTLRVLLLAATVDDEPDDADNDD